MERHKREIHLRHLQRFCPVPGCKYMAKRLEALRVHLAKRHGHHDEGRIDTDAHHNCMDIFLTIPLDTNGLLYDLKIDIPNTVLQVSSLGTSPQTV
jgi:hypothetical protein